MAAPTGAGSGNAVPAAGFIPPVTNDPANPPVLVLVSRATATLNAQSKVDAASPVRSVLASLANGESSAGSTTY